MQLAALGYCGKRISNKLAATCLAGVSERTVSARFKELAQMLLGLAQQLPFGKILTEKNLLKQHLKRVLDHVHIAAKAAEQSASVGSVVPAYEASRVKRVQREMDITAALQRIQRVAGPEVAVPDSSPEETPQLMPTQVTHSPVAVGQKRSRSSEQQMERLLAAGCDRHKLAEGYLESALSELTGSTRGREELDCEELGPEDLRPEEESQYIDSAQLRRVQALEVEGLEHAEAHCTLQRLTAKGMPQSKAKLLVYDQHAASAHAKRIDACEQQLLQQPGIEHQDAGWVRSQACVLAKDLAGTQPQ